jgi:hypothetical protein
MGHANGQQGRRIAPRLARTAQSTQDDTDPLRLSGTGHARWDSKWRRADVGVTHKEHSCRQTS